MKFKIISHLTYEAAGPSTILLNVHAFPSDRQKVVQEIFQATPNLAVKELISVSGQKRIAVVEIAEAGPVSFSYEAVVENEVKIIPAEELTDVLIGQMPVEVLPYLNPSRYCQSDRLYKFASHKFGHIANTFEKVMAIRDWIHENVEYGGTTNAQTSAFDSITEQVGVCRDFAHLGVALCRAQTIPARYVTAYAYQLNPPDFHACFEAYLGGHWVIFDATKLVPVNGLIKIATGTDAAETAFASSFGPLSFKDMVVSAELIDESFEAVDRDSLTQGYSYS